MSFECNPLWFSSYRGAKKLTFPKSGALRSSLAHGWRRAWRDPVAARDYMYLHSLCSTDVCKNPVIPQCA
eukprot:1132333-Prymnesium_polylepis.1